MSFFNVGYFIHLLPYVLKNNGWSLTNKTSQLYHVPGMYFNFCCQSHSETIDCHGFVQPVDFFGIPRKGEME